jgi:thioredoxin-like negative regulator of GroEL
VSPADAFVPVTGESWDDRVLGAAEPVLVDFWAPWCVPSLPTLMLFAGGEPVARLTGAVKPKKIEAAVAPHLTTTDPEGPQ